MVWPMMHTFVERRTIVVALFVVSAARLASNAARPSRMPDTCIPAMGPAVACASSSPPRPAARSAPDVPSHAWSAAEPIATAQ